MIEREMLEEMFDNMRESGFDTESEMRWGYFFTDRDASRLQAVIPLLEEKGYQFGSLFLNRDVDEGEEEYFILQLERIEQHTVDSLDQLNATFEEFARQHDLESYDGMDAGPLDDEPEDEEDEHFHHDN